MQGGKSVGDQQMNLEYKTKIKIKIGERQKGANVSGIDLGGPSYNRFFLERERKKG